MPLSQPLLLNNTQGQQQAAHPLLPLQSEQKKTMTVWNLIEGGKNLPESPKSRTGDEGRIWKPLQTFSQNKNQLETEHSKKYLMTAWQTSPKLAPSLAGGKIRGAPRPSSSVQFILQGLCHSHSLSEATNIPPSRQAKRAEPSQAARVSQAKQTTLENICFSVVLGSAVILTRNTII